MRNKEAIAEFMQSIDINTLLGCFSSTICCMDLEGRIVWCNLQQAQVFGLERIEDLIGKNIFDVAEMLGWDSAMADVIHANDKLVLSESKTLTVEEVVFLKGERRTFVSYKNPLMSKTGEVMGIMGVAIDITEKKQAEKLRAETEMAIIQERFDAVKTVAGTISHELRTPIASIKLGINYVKRFMSALIDGYTAYLAQNPTAAKPLSADQLQRIANTPEQIIKIADNCNQIINLQLSNIKSDKLTRNETSICSMRTILQTALDEYPFEGKALGLVNYQPESLNDFQFMGDPLLIKHVFWNLVQNAIYFITAARKGEIQIWSEQTQKYNILHFKDTGSGIKQEVLPRIFDEFFTKRHNGTGLGLYYCKSVMESLQGKIDCDSVEGEYVHFRLYFPVLKA